MRKKFKVLFITLIISIDKKIDVNKLYDHIIDLDLDEGIRLENAEKTKKIFINRNLLGIYIILIRTLKFNWQRKEEEYDKEDIYNLNDAISVLKLINLNLDTYDVWIY
jgi:hypothetical protein